MSNPFTYMFKDKKIVSKAIFLSLLFVLWAALLFVGALLLKDNLFFGILPALGLIVYILITGYYISCIQSNIKNNETPNLPYLKVSDLKLGAKYILASILYTFLVLVCALPVALISLVPKVGEFLSGAGLSLFQIFLAIIMPAQIYLFAKTENVLSLVRWGKAIHIINNGIRKYVKAIIFIILLIIMLAGFYIAIALVLFLFAKVPVVNISGLEKFIPVLVVSAILYFMLLIYSFFVNVHIIANCSDLEIEE